MCCAFALLKCTLTDLPFSFFFPRGKKRDRKCRVEALMAVAVFTCHIMKSCELCVIVYRVMKCYVCCPLSRYGEHNNGQYKTS